MAAFPWSARIASVKEKVKEWDRERERERPSNSLPLAKTPQEDADNCPTTDAFVWV